MLKILLFHLRWTERIGFVAAINTIKIFQKKKLWGTINKIGKKIKLNWIKIAKKNNINIKVNKVDAMPSFFTFNYGIKNNLLETIFIEEMLNEKILTSTSIYPCLAHNNNILKKYFKSFDKVFNSISKMIVDDDFSKYNNLKLRSDAFQRLSK